MLPFTITTAGRRAATKDSNACQSAAAACPTISTGGCRYTAS
jgi:hypothetical protein